MSLFFVDDYPDWVEEVHQYFCKGTVITDQSIWEVVKEFDDVPHIGNVVVSMLFSNIIDALKELKPDIEVECEANATGSYLTINGVDVTSSDEIENLLEEMEEEDD